ncbi:MAG: glycine zipper family protein [Pseudomonadota bacterium]
MHQSQWKYLALLLAVIGLAGCSSAPGPIVDTKGVNMADYHVDLAECESYAEQVRIESGVLRGAAAGGAVGAATGAILGESIGEYAGVGAVAGGAQSGIQGDREKSQVVKRCMRGRGYRVLN